VFTPTQDLAQRLPPAKDAGQGKTQHLTAGSDLVGISHSGLGPSWGTPACLAGSEGRGTLAGKGGTRWGAAWGGSGVVERGQRASVGRGAGLGLQRGSLERVEEEGGEQGAGGGCVWKGDGTGQSPASQHGR